MWYLIFLIFLILFIIYKFKKKKDINYLYNFNENDIEKNLDFDQIHYNHSERIYNNVYDIYNFKYNDISDINNFYKNTNNNINNIRIRKRSGSLIKNEK